MELINEEKTEQDLCLDCGATIVARVHRQSVGPGIIRVNRQVRCIDCGYRSYFKAQTVVQKCPYKTPIERPPLSGKAPESFVQWYANQHQQGAIA